MLEHVLGEKRDETEKAWLRRAVEKGSGIRTIVGGASGKPVIIMDRDRVLFVTIVYSKNIEKGIYSSPEEIGRLLVEIYSKKKPNPGSPELYRAVFNAVSGILYSSELSMDMKEKYIASIVRGLVRG